MSKLYSKLRSIGRHLYLDLVGINAHPSNGIHILNGHMIQKDFEKYDEGAEQFRAILTRLSKSCEFIRIEEAVRLISNHVIVNKPMIAFTFDDGFEDCYTYIGPILEEFGTNALFFINPNFVESNDDYISHFTKITTLSPGKKPMRWEQIRKLQDRGFLFGAHTMDHYMINSEDEEILEYQIGYCKQVIEEKLGIKCDYFAFPYGRLEHANKKAIEIACSHYKSVFSQSNYKHYFSYNGKVINRRHFEPYWDIKHVIYFLSCRKR